MQHGLVDMKALLCLRHTEEMQWISGGVAEIIAALLKSQTRKREEPLTKEWVGVCWICKESCAAATIEGPDSRIWLCRWDLASFLRKSPFGDFIGAPSCVPKETRDRVHIVGFHCYVCGEQKCLEKYAFFRTTQTMFIIWVCQDHLPGLKAAHDDHGRYPTTKDMLLSQMPANLREPMEGIADALAESGESSEHSATELAESLVESFRDGTEHTKALIRAILQRAAADGMIDFT